jgi:di/tripeptidase
MVSEFSMGVQLFERDKEFFKTVNEVLSESFVESPLYQSHPYTDIYALKRKFGFSCLNFAIGYYQYHTKNEYVVVEDVYNGIESGKKIIEKLGCNLYKFPPQLNYQYRLFD